MVQWISYLVAANIWKEEVFPNDVPHVVNVSQFIQVLLENKQHLVVRLPIVIFDGNAILQVTGIGLHSIVHYYYIL